MATVVTAVIIVVGVYEGDLPNEKTGVPTGLFQLVLSCTHAGVSAKAHYLCEKSNSTTVTLNASGFDSCSASSCSLMMTAATFSPYFFSNWTASGDAFFGTSGSGCTDSQFNRSYSVTLCMTAPGSAAQYNGSIAVNSV